jgi:GntR family transcriptional regulator / MocR family aminotransferase
MGSAVPSLRKLPDFSVDRASRVALHEQLQQTLRRAIDEGALGPGERLPPIRELAAHLQLSRNTVRRALEQLLAAGRLEGSSESGFRVRVRDPQPPVFDQAAVIERIDSSRIAQPGAPRPLRPAFPDAARFPIEIWESLRAKVIRQQRAELFEESDAFGYAPLRDAIANRLRGARGVAATAAQVVITTGPEQALHLVAQTLVSPGDLVAVEEPGLYAAKAIFEHAGVRVAPLLVDEEGAIVPDARRQNPPAAIYTTPSNQFPLAVKLSDARRAALLEFARITGRCIIEADWDAELNYNGARASLQGSDQHGRVIYAGAFHQTLLPSLHIGYLIVPERLRESFAKTAALIGAKPPILDQATLERFLRDGHFDEHLRGMNALYYRRLQTLAESMDSELDEFIDFEPPEAGLHAIGWLKRGVDEQLVASCAARAGIEAPLLSQFGRTALLRPGIVFGFAPFSEKQIRRAVGHLRRALEAAIRPGIVRRLLNSSAAPIRSAA